MNKNLRVIYNGNLEVGENPLWNHQRSELIFIDILGKSMYIKKDKGSIYLVPFCSLCDIILA